MHGTMISVFVDENNYYPGSTVTGRVEVQTGGRSLRVKALHVEARGACRVNWEEAENSKRVSRRQRNSREWQLLNDEGQSSVSFHADEEYFYHKNSLLGPTELRPGKSSFTFNFLLPADVPPSFSGEFGGIRYSVTGVLDLGSPASQHSELIEFHVTRPITLNNKAIVMKPLCYEKETKFCCLCCKSGPVQISVTAPRSGYICGDVIPLDIEVENGSDVQIRGFNCTMVEKVQWVSSMPKHAVRVTERELRRIELQGVGPHSTGSLHTEKSVPFLNTLSLLPCGIISLSFLIQIEAIVSGTHKNIVIRLPLLLGNESGLNGGNATAPPAQPAFNPAFDSVQPEFNPVLPSHTIGQPAFSPAQMSQTTGQPAFNPALPSHSIGQLAFNPAQPSHTMGQSAFNPVLPSHTIGQPAFSPAQMSQTTGQPAFNPALPSHSIGQLAFNPALPSHTIGQSAFNPAVPFNSAEPSSNIR